MGRYHLIISVIILEGVNAITKESLDQLYKITNDFAYETTPKKKKRRESISSEKSTIVQKILESRVH